MKIVVGDIDTEDRGATQMVELLIPEYYQRFYVPLASFPDIKTGEELVLVQTGESQDPPAQDTPGPAGLCNVHSARYPHQQTETCKGWQPVGEPLGTCDGNDRPHPRSSCLNDLSAGSWQAVPPNDLLDLIASNEQASAWRSVADRCKELGMKWGYRQTGLGDVLGFIDNTIKERDEAVARADRTQKDFNLAMERANMFEARVDGLQIRIIKQREALAIANTIIGQCDCIMEEGVKNRWYEARKVLEDK